MARLRGFPLIVVLAAMALPTNASWPADSNTAENVPAATVKKAGAALAHVVDIEGAYSTQLDAAPTPLAAQKMVDQMAGETVKAIRDQGLSPAEYKHVMEVAESDPELQDRLLMAAESSQ